MAKVLHCINDDSVARGGAQKILNLLKCDDVKVITLKQFGVSNKIVTLSMQIFYYLITSLFSKADCVFIHSRCYLPLSIVFRMFGVHTVFYTHAHYRKHRWLFKLFECNSYIAVSKAVADSLVLDGVDEESVIVISNPNVMSLVEKKSEAKHYSINNVASIGSLKSWKGFDLALSLLGVLSDDRGEVINYSIVGEGPLREKLESLSFDLGLVNLSLLGYCESPFALIEDDPIVIIPSLEEGFGLVAIEAISQNKILLYSNVPALKEVCGDDPLSFSFDVKDIESFKGAFSLAERSLSKLNSNSIRDNRQNRILNEFGIGGFYMKHNKFLKQVIHDELY